MGRVARVIGLLALGVHRVTGRVRAGRGRRTALSVVGVALAVGLMLIVTGTSLGLATQNSVYGANVGYWIVPQSASASTMPVSVGGPRFGSVHAASVHMSSFSGVHYATPVSFAVANLSTANASAYVLVAGVVVHPAVTISGVDTTALASGDPHYANGTYNGSWTGQMVVSSGAAGLLNATDGTAVTFPAGHGANASAGRFHVVSVQSASANAVGSFPIAVVHSSELQSLTGSSDGDTAGRILVNTNRPSVRKRLASVYPDSKVVSASGGSLRTITDSKLALAVGLTAFVVAVVVGTLFVATSMGLEVTADRREFATLAALGLPWRSQALVLGAQTVTVTLVGGVLGAALGIGGIAATNQLAEFLLGTGRIARFTPVLAGYGIAVAVAIGVLAVPYLVWLLTRTSVLDNLST